MKDDITPQLITEAKSTYKKLHSSIMGEISSMLKTAKLEPIRHLAGLDPSFASLVEDLELYRKIIQSLIDNLGINVNDLEAVDKYIELARDLAESIDSECSDSLGAAIAALDEMPYV